MDVSLGFEVHVHTVHTCTYCTVVLLNTTIPDWSSKQSAEELLLPEGVL